MYKKITNTLVIILLGICIFFMSCEDGFYSNDDDVDNTDFIASEDFSFEVAVVNHTQFRLEGINGEVTINGDPSAESVIIEGVRKVGSESMEDALEHLDKLEVQLQDLADEVFVKTVQPNETHGRNYTVDYSVTLPQDLLLGIVNVNGIVSIESIENHILVANVNGQIILNEINAEANVSLVNGLVNCEIELPLNGVLIMNNTNGVIDLEIPENTSAQFSANLVNGNFYISGLDFQNEIITSTSFQGTLGEGNGVISINNVNGNIVVSGY